MKTAKLPPHFLAEVAEAIKVIGHPRRLELLEHLDLHGECNVRELTDALSGQQPAISQHLNKMRAAGILSARRDGQQIFYRIASVHAVTILNCIRKKHGEHQV